MRRTRQRGLSTIQVGLIALVAVLAATYLGFTKSIPFRSHFEIKAAFKTSNNITPNSPVRIAGVTVGKVTAVDHAPGGGEGATVTMRIDKKGRPLHKDATMAIRPRIFLEGNFFVDIQPGTPSAPELGDGDTVPVNQTRTPVQLDQILTALQSDTRDELRTLLREYGGALNGEDAEGAKAFNRSIGHWLPAYRDSAIVADATLGQAEHDLSEYVKGAGATAEALDRNANQLKSLITDFFATARGFASESGNLQQAIAELPRTLRAAQPALGALNASFPALRGLARDLRPGVRSSGPTLDAAIPFTRQLRGLVSQPEARGLARDLRPTVPALARLTEGTPPLYREVRSASSCQNEVILPWSRDKVIDDKFPAEGRVFEEAPKPLPGLAGESRSGDANGQWFRVLVAGGTNLVTLRPGIFATTAEPLLGSNPPKPTSRPPNRNDVPCETQQPPDLRTRVGQPPPQRRIDTNNPAFKARYELARKRAIKWLEGQLKYEGLDKLLNVVDRDATKGLIDQIGTKVKAARDAQAAKIREQGR
jgi:phospholipid/cholesterol/gamma-HCH transport system substrate-binding protein